MDEMGQSLLAFLVSLLFVSRCSEWFSCMWLDFLGNSSCVVFASFMVYFF